MKNEANAEKLSKILTGRKFSEEHKNISESLKNRKRLKDLESI